MDRLCDGLDMAVTAEGSDLLRSDERGVGGAWPLRPVAARRRLWEGVEGEQILVHGALQTAREEVELLGWQRVRGGGWSPR